MLLLSFYFIFFLNLDYELIKSLWNVSLWSYHEKIGCKAAAPKRRQPHPHPPTTKPMLPTHLRPFAVSVSLGRIC